MHISTIVRDCSWFKHFQYLVPSNKTVAFKRYLIASTTLVLSLLHGAGFIGAMYLSMDIVFSQYALASPLPICTIIFTAFYGVTEVVFGLLQLAICPNNSDARKDSYNVQNIDNYSNSKNAQLNTFFKIWIFCNRVSVVGMITCATAGVVEYCNSNAGAPCMLHTLSEKIHLSPAMIAGTIAVVVILLLGLYVVSALGRARADGDDKSTFLGTAGACAMIELKGFAAPCLCG